MLLVSCVGVVLLRGCSWLVRLVLEVVVEHLEHNLLHALLFLLRARVHAERVLVVGFVHVPSNALRRILIAACRAIGTIFRRLARTNLPASPLIHRRVAVLDVLLLGCIGWLCLGHDHLLGRLLWALGRLLLASMSGLLVRLILLALFVLRVL